MDFREWRWLLSFVVGRDGIEVVFEIAHTMFENSLSYNFSAHLILQLNDRVTAPFAKSLKTGGLTWLTTTKLAPISLQHQGKTLTMLLVAKLSGIPKSFVLRLFGYSFPL
jgi:hypothetical protein